MTLVPPALTTTRVAERAAVDPQTFAAEVRGGDAPVILRGQFAHWPAVVAGLQGPRATALPSN